MRRLFIFSLMLAACIMIMSADCYALSESTTYKVTVVSIQMRNSSSGSWVTIASPNQEINLRNAAENGVAGSLLSDAEIPVGTYDNFKIVLSETMIIAGTDGSENTASGGAVTIKCTEDCCDSTSTWSSCTGGSITGGDAELNETVNSRSSGAVGETTFTLDLDNGDNDSTIEIYASSPISTPITINANSVISMWFDFDTQNTLLWRAFGEMDIDVDNDGGFAFFPPSTGTQFSITVDGTTSTITATDMQLDF